MNGRSLFVTAITMAAIACPAVAKAQTVIKRPANYESGTTFSNPGQGNNNNDADWAAKAFTTACDDGTCGALRSASITYEAFPSGYHAIRLEVKWSSDAAQTVFGGSTA